MEAKESRLPRAENSLTPGGVVPLGAGKKRLCGSRLRGEFTLPVYID